MHISFRDCREQDDWGVVLNIGQWKGHMTGLYCRVCGKGYYQRTWIPQTDVSKFVHLYGILDWAEVQDAVAENDYALESMGERTSSDHIYPVSENARKRQFRK